MHRKTYKLDSSLLNWSIFESAALVTFHIHCFDIVDANPIETCAAYENFWMCRHVAPKNWFILEAPRKVDFLRVVESNFISISYLAKFYALQGRRYCSFVSCINMSMEPASHNPQYKGYNSWAGAVEQCSG